MRTNYAFVYRDKIVNDSYTFLNNYYKENPKKGRLLGFGVALIDVCAYPVASLAHLVEGAVCMFFSLVGKCCCKEYGDLNDFIFTTEDFLYDIVYLFVQVAFAPVKFVYQAIRIQTDLDNAVSYAIIKDPDDEEEAVEGAAS